MNWCLTIDQIQDSDRPRVGGKAYALKSLVDAGFKIPETLCVTADTYQEYISHSGLKERILLELHRKAFRDMRWEEIWDAALRIRNLFLRNPIPGSIEEPLRLELTRRFKDVPVVVRSSAPEEDTGATSFAGLHESYVNIKGVDAILENIRKVWASLWSDKALLYRQELGLQFETSTMGVVVQDIVIGDRSGIAFSKNPNAEYQAVVEAVYGLNEGLVNGTIEPDRWIFDRASKNLISHSPAQRNTYMRPDSQGVHVERLPEKLSKHPPLSDPEAATIFKTVLKAETYFNRPQDMEWTIRNNDVYILQSRPITTVSDDKSDDPRKWYISLHRSYENLKTLRQKIENQLIPDMIEEANRLSQIDFTQLTDAALVTEIRRRILINDKWTGVYWEDFIPFAHGIRLFGQVYNDAIRPENPYEFMDLLGSTSMASLERNILLAEMSEMIRLDPVLRKNLEQMELDRLNPAFINKLDAFIQKFGDLSCSVTGGTQCNVGSDAMIKVLLEMASHPSKESKRQRTGKFEQLKSDFLNRFSGEAREQMSDLLDLARASYRLRDDDNIHLGRIEAQMLDALNEAKQRIATERKFQLNIEDPEEIIKTLTDRNYHPPQRMSGKTKRKSIEGLKARQLIGQPAGPGISKGKARVVNGPADLPDFKYGEVLVCDAVDPNMTFVVPLANGVVERRGGMLIHGAIIAREYGLPCVTGVTEATDFIRTGDELTVDGYLGIVTLGSSQL